MSGFGDIFVLKFGGRFVKTCHRSVYGSFNYKTARAALQRCMHVLVVHKKRSQLSFETLNYLECELRKMVNTKPRDLIIWLRNMENKDLDIWHEHGVALKLIRLARANSVFDATILKGARKI
jgi:hypothetical protein